MGGAHGVFGETWTFSPYEQRQPWIGRVLGVDKRGGKVHGTCVGGE